MVQSLKTASREFQPQDRSQYQKFLPFVVRVGDALFHADRRVIRTDILDFLGVDSVSTKVSYTL